MTPDQQHQSPWTPMPPVHSRATDAGSPSVAGGVEGPMPGAGARPDGLLGPGIASCQIQFISGVRTRLRVDVHEGWLALTGILIPRDWRRFAQLSAVVFGVVIGLTLVLLRPVWSPRFFAVLAGVLVLFLMAVMIASRPSRIVSLVLPLASVGFSAPAAAGMLDRRKTIVTLLGPFGGERSDDGTIKLACSGEADAQALVAALQSGPRPAAQGAAPGHDQ